jgi:subtilisin family serine protease
MNPIHKVNTRVHSPIVFLGDFLINRSQMVDAFVQKQLSLPYNIELARCVLSNQIASFYQTSNLSYRSLDSYTANEKRQILEKYNSLVYEVQDLCASFQEDSSSSKREWAEILRLVFNPENNLIYFSEERFLVLWGFAFFNSAEYSIPRDKLPLPPAKIKEVPEEFVSVADSSSLNNEAPTIASPEPEKETRPQPSDHLDQASQDNLSRRLWIRSQKKDRRGFWVRLFSGVGWFLLRSWWLWLIAFALYYFFIRPDCVNCDDEQEVHSAINDKDTQESDFVYIPDYGQPPPAVDPRDIGFDEDSLFQIVVNRLNVALKGKNQDFNKFLNDLDQKFLNQTRKVISYDSTTTRCLIEFDIQKNPDIKQEIRKTLSDYKLLAWDEAVFAHTWAFNDAELSDKRKSWYLQSLNMEAAWKMSTGKEEIVVAVVDDGFELAHPEFSGKKIVSPYNLQSRDKNVNASPSRMHGTHVASTALANGNNSVGLAGIAPNCSFMPIQIGNDQNGVITNSDIIDGILYAVHHGAHVVNLSIGKMFPPQFSQLPENEQKQIMQNYGLDEAEFWNELFIMAQTNGTVLVIAAGNSNVLCGVDPMQRSAHCILVGAHDRNNQLASFSNYGDQVTVDAPGVAIFSAIPGRSFDFMDGTSMAAPIISGCVALYKSLDNKADAQEIVSALKKSCNVSASANKKAKILDVAKFLDFAKR